MISPYAGILNITYYLFVVICIVLNSVEITDEIMVTSVSATIPLRTASCSDISQGDLQIVVMYTSSAENTEEVFDILSQDISLSDLEPDTLYTYEVSVRRKRDNMTIGEVRSGSFRTGKLQL